MHSSDINYPDALTTFDGRKVKNAKMWFKVRRPELVKVEIMNIFANS